MNDVVVTTDNRYIKILEIKPITFHFRPESEKAAIISNFAALLNIIPSNAQITVMTMPADASAQIDKLEKNEMRETSASCRDMDEEYREILQASQRNGYTRRFFFSFEYQKLKGGAFHEPTLSEILADLEDAASAVSSGLSSCGNEVIRPTEDDLRGSAAEILYKIINRRTDVSVLERYEEIQRRYLYKYGSENAPENGYYISPARLLAPESMNTWERKYMVVDGLYYSFLFIPSAGYTDTVAADWLFNVFGSYQGVDINIYLQKMPGASVLNSLRRNLTYNEADYSEASAASAAYDRTSAALSSGMYLKSGILAQQAFFYFAVMLTVTGGSPDEVDWKCDQLKDDARRSAMRLYELPYQEEEAFLSALPLCRLDKSIWNRGKRNALAGDLASIYPFTAAEVNDPEGIYYGRDRVYGSLIIPDLWSERYHNANVFICGTSGGGKSYTLKLIAMRLRFNHVPVYAIIPEKADEFRIITQAVGGTFVDISPSSGSRINVLEIFPMKQSAAKKVTGASFNPISDKIQSLQGFFSLLFGREMSALQNQLLNSALVRVYADKGIDINDPSSLHDPAQPGRYKQMPILSDLQKELDKDERTRNLAILLGAVTEGAGANFNGQTNVDLSNEFIVFGLDNLSRKFLPLGMFITLEYLWNKVREDDTSVKAVLIDEMWKLAYNETAAEYLLQMAKLIRYYGGSLILSTQQMKDVFAANQYFGDGILNNSSLKIILPLEAKDADVVEQFLHLPSSEVSSMVGQKAGNALLVAGDNHISMRFESSYTEDLLCETRARKREEYNHILEEKYGLKNKENSFSGSSTVDHDGSIIYSLDLGQPPEAPEQKPDSKSREYLVDEGGDSSGTLS